MGVSARAIISVEKLGGFTGCSSTPTQQCRHCKQCESERPGEEKDNEKELEIKIGREKERE